MEDISQELIEFLDALASRMGGPAAHIWEIVVRQQVVVSATSLFVILLFIGACLGFLAFSIKRYRVEASIQTLNRKEGLRYNDDYYIWVVIAFVVAFFIFMGLYLVIAPLSNLLNPEYGALTDLITKVRGGR